MKLAVSILAGEGPETPTVDETTEAYEQLSRAQFIRIYEFLEKVQLDPLPENYRLVWEYLHGSSNKLRAAVDTRLNLHGRLTNENVTAIFDECDGQIKLAELAEMIAEGEAVVASSQNTLDNSGKENAAYAKALQTRLDWMQDLSPQEHRDQPIEAQFKALLKITKQILASTIEARDSLRTNTEKLAVMRERLDNAQLMAQRDQLTGLPNRWAFEQVFAAAVIRAKERMEPLSVGFIDIDHFKHVNDAHGHETGDRVLQMVAKHLDRLTNGQCHLARHGGEEFVIIFEGYTAPEMKDALDLVREHLAERTLLNKENGESIGHITFSGGVAEFYPAASPRQILRNADIALYAAKNSGRNRIHVFERQKSS